MNFSVNFVVRSTKANKNGLSPIEAAINVNGKRTFITLPRKIKPELWDSVTQQITKGSAEAEELNTFLNITKIKLYECQSKLMRKDVAFTTDTIKDMFFDKIDGNDKSLVGYYKQHNDDIQVMVNKTITYNTLQKHRTVLKHLIEFLKLKYKRNDIQLVEITKTFVNEFFNFLRNNKSIGNNTSMHYMKSFKKVITMAYNDNIIQINPFNSFKMRFEAVEIDFLTMEELKKIYKKDFKNNRLNAVKDIFIFACFTGLAYIDCKEFNVLQHLKKDNDGKYWIMKPREKTNVMSTIPLLPIPLEILQKWNYKLPVLSNQKMNAYLKEIADCCRLNKDIHFHCARHTFCTSVTLNNGVPLTSVSKMVGHTSVKMTQRYAAVLESTLSSDMNTILDKIAL